MTMKSCPECSHEVSSAALACPSCGFPLKEEPFIAYTQRRLDFIKKVAVGFIIVAILFTFLGFVDEEFLGWAMVSGIGGLLSLFSLVFAQARLNKSKLK